MIIPRKIFRIGTLLFTVFMLGLVSGCSGSKKINNDSVSYTPEQRPLGVIAGGNIQAKPGTQVALTGRLTGTVTTQSVLWTQISGTAAVDVKSWTSPTLEFTAPDIQGSENLVFQIAAVDSSGNQINDASGNPLVAQVTVQVYDPALMSTIQAEDTTYAQLVGGPTFVGAGDPNYITGAVGTNTTDLTPGSSLNYTIPSGSVIVTNGNTNTIDPGFYTLFINYAIPTSYGGKEAQVIVNGVTYSGLQFNATSSWQTFQLPTPVKIVSGDNTIDIGGGWSYYRIDSITLLPAPAPKTPIAVPATLVNPDATAATKDLMAFLVSNYGKKTISGQTEYMNYGNPTQQTGLRDFNKIVSITGSAAPAIEAFDLKDYSSSSIACGANPGTLSEDMIAAHNTKNIILSPLWHWNAPTHLLDSTCSGTGANPWYSGFYTTASTFNLHNALADPASTDYQALVTDIDNISAQLKKFSDAGIPLMWRPLHEAEGGWFWWGASGAADFKSLWQLMYNRMTTTNGLDNLIWVYTCTNTCDPSWYPGDAYVDIVGYDGYDGNNAETTFTSEFATLKSRYDGKKLVALTETGTVPDVSAMQSANAWWAYFVTWNSDNSTTYGPVNEADPATIAKTYSFAGTETLTDVPGGRSVQQAGVYDNGFEPATSGWGAQVSWTDVPGATTSSVWAANGLNSLSVTENLSAVSSPTNVVLQTYPSGGIAVGTATTLSVTVNATNSGTGTTAYLFVKSGPNSDWHATTPVVVASTPTTISLDVTGLGTLNGVGVVFENFDTSSTAANFYADTVTLDGTVLYDFEPPTSGWGAQVSWTDTSGTTLSPVWSNTGARSLSVTKNLSAISSPSNVVLQTYPSGGVAVGSATTLSVTVNATNSGTGTTAYLFVKSGPNSDWHATTPVVVASTPTTISLDVTGLGTLNGVGVVFENFDTSSTAANFYADTVTLDGTVLYDFEGADDWQFQVNWTTTTGMQLCTDWVNTGMYSLCGMTQLKDGDDNVILQTYPAGGLLLGNVTTLKVSAHATDVGSAAQAMLFVKDKDGNWSDGGAVNLVNGSANLSIDISSLGGELSGFGVRFMGPVNSTTPSKYYIDDVTFQ
ncbi:MAG TPA: glycosyl hydrolase [Steroidobacteraceae bacterium]|nr:glycosyl hydrolase [Steroidobacteraceae bacterium]